MPQRIVDRRSKLRTEVTGLFSPRHLLLRGNVVEKFVLLDWAARGEAGTQAVFIRLARYTFQRRRPIQRSVLNEQKDVAMLQIAAGTCFDIDRPTRGTAILGGIAVIHDLKVADGFRG